MGPAAKLAMEKHLKATEELHRRQFTLGCSLLILSLFA